MKVSEKIDCLRKEMAEEGIDYYIIPSADFHHSEYVGEYFKTREYMTGFTGSAGTAVFGKEQAYLWTDGRYFLQAEDQLKGSGITLCKMGEPGVDTIEEFLEKELPQGGVLGFDGRVIGLAEGRKYEKIVKKKGGSIVSEYDLADRIWEDRPELPTAPVFLLGEKYAGESVSSKLERIRMEMEDVNADLHIVSSLDDVAWILNMRGDDVAYCPVVLSYAVIRKDSVVLYADKEKFSQEIRSCFEKDHISILPYNDIYSDLGKLEEGETILIDPERTSYALYYSISENAVITEGRNPSILMKSIKNETEAENIRNAHLKDAVAHTKFMYWLKNAIGKEEITEISAAEKLEEFRAQQEGYMGASFAPICAFGEHGAIIHYSATEASNIALKPGKLFLSDTGGHYMEGSTDITRTVALGEVSEQEKEDLTLVARAMLRLANAVFLYGCSGASLDCIARDVFWKERKNYNHGTGHGVGYMLSIHEAPINFRWNGGNTAAQKFEENMVITDEPGIYIGGSHGIRIENELMVRKAEKNEYGQFMDFEVLTYVPIDLDAILPEKMSEEERQMLDVYHGEVFRKVSPYLSDEEKEWLRVYTRPISEKKVTE